MRLNIFDCNFLQEQVSQTVVDSTQVFYMQTLLPLGLCCLPTLLSLPSAKVQSAQLRPQPQKFSH